MTKIDEVKLTEFFVKAFKDVVLPVLEQHHQKFADHDKRFDDHDKRFEQIDKRFEEIIATQDAHTLSLMRLEVIEKLLRELVGDFKNTKTVLNDHETRIVSLESA